MRRVTPSQLLTSANQNWETPPELFDLIQHAVRGFDVDAAASKQNTLCKKFWDIETDGLKQNWDDKKIWCNPPYDNQKVFFQKAYDAKNNLSVFLIPARPDTRLWQDGIFSYAHSIIFLKGRLKFLKDGLKSQSATFPSAVVIFDSSGSELICESVVQALAQNGRCVTGGYASWRVGY